MGLAVLMALSLSVAPQIYVTSSLAACPAESMASALHTMRPGLAVVAGGPEPIGRTVRVLVSGEGGLVSVRVDTGGRDTTREFANPDDCASTSQTVALIVDRALEDVNVGHALRTPTTFASPRPFVLSVAAGGGLKQGVLGATGTVILEVDVRHGIGALGLTGELDLPTNSAIPGEMGSFHATGGTLELSAGISPILGPGRLTAAATIGLAWTSVAAVSGTLYQRHQSLATDPFVGARLGYGMPLPWQLFVVVRFEERLSLGRTAFALEGAQASVATRAWTSEGSLLVGRSFF
jgi:hypothetical protein